MPEVSIVYWRDIPAQIVLGRGRRAIKRPLPERFEQAIDRAAMATGATGTDAYLEAWRRGAPYPVEAPSDEDAADAEVARIAAIYDAESLRALVAAGGRAST